MRRNTQLGRLGTVATVGVQVGQAGREGGRRRTKGVWMGALWRGGREVATLAGWGHCEGADVFGGGGPGVACRKRDVY